MNNFFIIPLNFLNFFKLFFHKMQLNLILIFFIFLLIMNAFSSVMNYQYYQNFIQLIYFLVLGRYLKNVNTY